MDMRCETGEYGVNPKGRPRVVFSNSDYNIWHEFVIHAKWSASEAGYFRVLQNGKMVMNYEGYTLAPNGQTEVEDHPQIYMYGGDDIDSWDQYKTPVTVWFDDMMRSTNLPDIQERYSFDPAEFDNHSAGQNITRLQPRAYTYYPPLNSLSDPRFENGTHEVWNEFPGDGFDISSVIITNLINPDGSLGAKFEFGIFGKYFSELGYLGPLSFMIDEPISEDIRVRLRGCTKRVRFRKLPKKWLKQEQLIPYCTSV